MIESTTGGKKIYVILGLIIFFSVCINLIFIQHNFTGVAHYYSLFPDEECIIADVKALDPAHLDFSFKRAGQGPLTMYLIAIFIKIGSLLGLVSLPTAAGTGFYARNPHLLGHLYIAGRLVSVLSTAGGILLAFLLLRKLLGQRWALYASFFTALYLTVSGFNYIPTLKSEATVCFLCTLFLFLFYLTRDRTKLAIYIITGLVGGLAIAAKYNAILLLGGVFLGQFLPAARRLRMNLRYMLLWSMVPLGFLLSYPYAIFDFKNFYYDLTIVSSGLGWQSTEIPEFIQNLKNQTHFFFMANPFLSIGYLLGLGLLIWKKRGFWIIALTGSLPAVLYLTCRYSVLNIARYYLPVFILCLLISLNFYRYLWERFCSNQAVRLGLLAILFVALPIFNFYSNTLRFLQLRNTHQKLYIEPYKWLQERTAKEPGKIGMVGWGIHWDFYESLHIGNILDIGFIEGFGQRKGIWADKFGKLTQLQEIRYILLLDNSLERLFETYSFGNISQDISSANEKVKAMVLKSDNLDVIRENIEDLIKTNKFRIIYEASNKQDMLGFIPLYKNIERILILERVQEEL